MYKFQTLTHTFSYPDREYIFVNTLNSQSVNLWRGSLPNPPFLHGCGVRRDGIKDYIKTELLSIQGDYCIYCGLKFRSTSDIQREHILPKDDYPAFTFEPYNLVLACGRCNGFDFKSTKDYSIRPVYLDDYSQNNFTIVHPYFDDIFDHINVDNVVLEVIGNSQKGQNTINEFGLNDEYHLKIRGGHISLVNNGLQNLDNNNLLIDILSGNYHYSF